MGEAKTDVLQGTLDLMVLKTLETLGPLHGYGIARRIEQVSENLLQLNQGTLYPALLRLQQRGWIKSGWGTSENNRKAKFYQLSPAGRRQFCLIRHAFPPIYSRYPCGSMAISSLSWEVRPKGATESETGISESSMPSIADNNSFGWPCGRRSHNKQITI